MSVIFVGTGKSAIAFIRFGDTLVGVISNPENSIVPAANVNLDGF